ncbi:MAG: hypothetical protein M3458_09775, partial [Acidobacteriota bacterium]|nr:hypothetical protein [Acidobacteriota bacterium]
MNRVLAPAAARQNVAPEVLYEKFKAKLKTALPLLRAASGTGRTACLEINASYCGLAGLGSTLLRGERMSL